MWRTAERRGLTGGSEGAVEEDTSCVGCDMSVSGEL